MIIAIALLAYVISGFPGQRPGPPAIADPTQKLFPTATPVPEITPVPTPTPAPLPYEGINMGFSAARFGISPFPDPEYWSETGKDMSGKFSGSGTQGIWVIGGVWKGGICYLNFPSSKKYPYVVFSKTDENEAYLDYFDLNGIPIILQIEPGEANIEDVIKLVLDQYSHHPCVTGIGVDVEWYKCESNFQGKQVSDEEAAEWYELINTYGHRNTPSSFPWYYPANISNKNYTLALTHWQVSKMPPTYRDGIYFLYDGLGFSSIHQMKNKCIQWGESFPDSPVGFYIGFPVDKSWWGSYDDPYYTIGETLLNNVSNAKGIYWVEFSITDLYPG